MNQNDKFDSQRLVTLVGYFATPFALILGLMGGLTAPVTDGVRNAVLGLLGFSAFFNLAFPKFLSQQALEAKGWNVKFRLYLNLVINTGLVYLLGEVFPAIWLILTLTPFATAIYGSREKTLANAVTASAILVTIQFLRAENGTLSWADLLARVAFIVLISLMINGVGSLVAHPEKEIAPKPA